MTTDIIYGVEPCDLCVHANEPADEEPCSECVHRLTESFFVLDKSKIKKL